jgi:hypothetical protein
MGLIEALLISEGQCRLAFPSWEFILSQLRAQKARWHQDLRARGLYTRGYTVRGRRRLKLARRAAKLAARLGIPCTTKP